jgi:hypothetical protein
VLSSALVSNRFALVGARAEAFCHWARGQGGHSIAVFDPDKWALKEENASGWLECGETLQRRRCR